MIKRLFSVLALALTLAAVTGLAEKQSPIPNPSCYPDGCDDGNVR